MTGIYKIECLSNGKIYVGQSIAIKRRWIKHRTKLNHNKHDNRYLQHAWNKYGEGNFEFSVLEVCRKDELDEKEIEWLSMCKKKRLLNLATPCRLKKYMLPTTSIKCYVLDTKDNSVLKFRSKERMRWYFNLGATTLLIQHYKIKNRYIVSYKKWTHKRIQRYYEKFRRYVYNKDGLLIHVFDTEGQMKRQLKIRYIRYGVGVMNHSGHRISYDYLGDKIAPYVENRGGNNALYFQVYDTAFNLVHEGYNVKGYCEERGLKIDRVRYAMKGRRVKYGDGKKKIKASRWYMGHYWSNGMVDVEQWVREHEWENHLARKNLSG